MERDADGTALHREKREAVTVGRVETMSKSKRNTVDPGVIIDRTAPTPRAGSSFRQPAGTGHGVDRGGVAGAHRFTQRLYRVGEVASGCLPPDGHSAEEASGAARKLRQTTHR